MTKEKVSMELGKLGTVFAESPDDENRYYPGRNPLLIPNVPNMSPMGGFMGFMNPCNFATPAAAEVMAGVFGAEVIQDPDTVNWTTGGVKALAIKKKGRNPFTINAGNLATVLGNDIEYPNAGKKSQIISTELIVGGALDLTIAEKLWVAIQPLL